MNYNSSSPGLQHFIPQSLSLFVASPASIPLFPQSQFLFGDLCSSRETNFTWPKTSQRTSSVLVNWIPGG